MRKILSMLLVVTMLLTMLSTVTFADFAIDGEIDAVDENVEVALYGGEYDPGDVIFYDDFTGFGTDAALSATYQNFFKSDRTTVASIAEVYSDLEPSSYHTVASISYDDPEIAGNTIGVMVFFHDWWLNGTINQKYQCPDIWGAYDFACTEAGVAFYAGTNEDDLVEIPIERAGFVHPGQGQALSCELLAQIPSDCTYFKFAFNNSAWEAKVGWVSLYAGSVADYEAATPETTVAGIDKTITYSDWDADLVMPTVTPTPTPKPVATVDPGTIDPETGIGVIINDEFDDMSMAYSYKNYSDHHSEQNISSAGTISNYIEPDHYTQPSEIVYRGQFGKASVTFLAFFHDMYISQTLPAAYPDIGDVWSAYEEAIEYAGYKVYAGPSENKMSLVNVDNSNVTFDFTRPTEGQTFGVWVTVSGLPSNAEFVKIELNLDNASWVAKLGAVIIEGDGTLSDEDIYGKTALYDFFADDTKMADSFGFVIKKNTKSKTGFGILDGFAEGNGNSDYTPDTYIAYNGEFGGLKAGFAFAIPDWRVNGEFYTRYKDVLEGRNRWQAYDLLYDMFRDQVVIYAGTSADDAVEVPLEYLIGGAAPAEGGTLACEVVTGKLPEGTTYLKFMIKHSNWKEQWTFVEVRENIIATDGNEMVPIPTAPVVTTAPTEAPTLAPTEPPTGTLTKFTDNFSSLRSANSAFLNNESVSGGKYAEAVGLCFHPSKSGTATKFNTLGGHVEGTWDQTPSTASISYQGEFGGNGLQVVLGIGDDKYKTAFYGINGDSASLQWGRYEDCWNYYFKDKLHFYAGTSADNLTEVATNALDGQGIQGFCVLAVNSDVLPADTTYFKIEIEDIFHWPFQLFAVRCDELTAINPDYTPGAIGGGDEPTPTEEPIVYGDVTGDDNINIEDVVTLVRYLGLKASGSELDPAEFPADKIAAFEAAADVTGDDIVNIEDIVLLVKYLGLKASGSDLDPADFPNGNFPAANK